MSRLSPKGNPTPGKECQDCFDRSAPSKLVKIGSTQNKKLAVVICPYCDGQRAIDLSKAKK